MIPLLRRPRRGGSERRAGGMNWRRKHDGIEVLRLCYVVSLESTLECWDLANGGCLGCWTFPGSARRVAACYGVWTEVMHVKSVQRAKRKEVSHDNYDIPR